ncbi:aldolase/citrate lyase family protein [Dehalococcoidia bacterium]|jgi:4-hydroxy-2-oxoheptanedioate aldolase|nr:aldolase/citrate lyase family protein [Dehalococcoidia bacterium]
MRPNKVKHKLERGEVASIVQGELTPDLVELLGPIGFDGIWIEGEHGPIDFGDIRDFTRAADLWGMTSVARVNLNLPGVIYRTLDQGAQAVVVPHVNTAEEAQAVVEASNFAPIGSRGSYTSRQGIGVDDPFTSANDETMAIILIEDIVAINNLEEILKVDHIDVFFVAPGDLAQTMGFLGQHEHPEVQATVDQAIEQIVSAGRVAGALVSEATVGHYIERGARFISTSYTTWFTSGAAAYLNTLSSAVSQTE